MDLAVLAVFSDSRTKGYGTDESEYAAYGVYDGRTGKVVERMSEGVHHEASLIAVAEPASAPCPVAGDGIDEQGDEYGIHAIHRELGAFCHRSRHNGCRCGTKHGLEDEKSLCGQSRRTAIE